MPGNSFIKGLHLWSMVPRAWDQSCSACATRRRQKLATKLILRQRHASRSSMPGFPSVVVRQLDGGPEVGRAAARPNKNVSVGDIFVALARARLGGVAPLKTGSSKERRSRIGVCKVCCETCKRSALCTVDKGPFTLWDKVLARVRPLDDVGGCAMAFVVCAWSIETSNERRNTRSMSCCV